MKILERQIKHVNPTMIAKWAVPSELDSVESACGFRPRKCYQLFSGGLAVDTVIIEREWESMAAMEAAYQKRAADPRTAALSKQRDAEFGTGPTQFELYVVL